MLVCQYDYLQIIWQPILAENRLCDAEKSGVNIRAAALTCEHGH